MMGDKIKLYAAGVGERLVFTFLLLSATLDTRTNASTGAGRFVGLDGGGVSDSSRLDTGGRCRCVPDQWQGVLSSVEREFDLLSGQTATTESTTKVFYDYRAKKLVTKDLRGGYTSIQDFARRYGYTIVQDRCRVRRIDEPMRRMCIPDGARYIGQHTIAVNVPVEIYEFRSPWNLTVRTTVDKRNCIPLDEQTHMSRPGYSSVTSSVYIDVSLSILDESAMKVPSFCREGESQMRMRRPPERWRAAKRIYHTLNNRSAAVNRLRMRLLSALAMQP